MLAVGLTGCGRTKNFASAPPQGRLLGDCFGIPGFPTSPCAFHTRQHPSASPPMVA